MRTRILATATTALAWACALVWVTGPVALAQERVADSSRVLVAPDSVNTDELHLRRAVLEQSVGNLRGVVENLEAIRFDAGVTFEEADRAAFLLGHAYLQLGSIDRFFALAENVKHWQHESIYTKWISYQQLLVQTDVADTTQYVAYVGDASAAADVLAAGLLLRQGHVSAAQQLLTNAQNESDARLIALYLMAVPTLTSGHSRQVELVELSRSKAKTDLGKTLVGAAIIRLATQAVLRGEDPTKLLETVPAESRYESRARHMMGVAALERGEIETGTEILESLLASDSTYTGRRDVLLALAARSLDEEDWHTAYRSYEQADGEWERQAKTLRHALEAGVFDRLWASWQTNDPLSDALTVDAIPTQLLADDLAGASVDLNDKPKMELPALSAPTLASPLSFSVPPPPGAQRDAVKMSERELADATADLETTRWDLERERERLEAMQRYFTYGQVQIGHERALLGERAALIDSLKKSLDAVLAKLRDARDESSRRIASRTARMLEVCTNHLIWMGAMQHFYVEGPNRERAIIYPRQVPSPEILMEEEIRLTRLIRDFADSLSWQAPGLIARSYDNAWEPGILDSAFAQSARVHGYLDWALALEEAVDSTIVASASSPRLERLETQLATLEQATDSLSVAHTNLKNQVAREAVESALAQMEAGREAIDYGLAASTYGLSVRLSRSDSSGVSVDSAPDTPESVAWRARSIVHMNTFLERHPDSFARGEMRFRLADLMLVDARQSFRERMAEFVRAQEEGRSVGALPLLDHGPALDIYKAILDEDKEFSHTDAVLFNAGMILVENVDPAAESYFQQLVTTFPESPFCQEAYLRMGDMHFNEKRFAECINLYERSVEGADLGLRVIALYKMGWAKFNEDRFVAAADDFRAVLDLYESNADAVFEVDVQDEAESYLIHTLARAGGAPAFKEYFDGIGARPYEMRLLMAMGQHFRRFSLYEEAADTDKLHIERSPDHPDALVSATRLTDTYRRWDRFDQARQAQLELAPHFAPGSEWYQAQESDSIKQAGAEFAKTSWTSVAIYHHKLASEEGTPEDWRAARQLYETILGYWPEDPNAASYRLSAGEASAELGEYQVALDHFAAAAASGTDSIPEIALRQRVAITDAWYEESRASNSAGENTQANDAMAQAVLEAGDELLTRYPEHRGAKDILWRQGNLAFAHGWYERAADDFDRMATRFPDDERVPRGSSLRAEALFRIHKYEDAGAAFEVAHRTALQAGNDSLATRAANSVPVCYYRHAEAAVAADSTNFTEHAVLFEKVATGWPDYEHAHLAQYRAGLAYLNAGMHEDGVRVMEAHIEQYPEGVYAKDAHLHIAKTWESTGHNEKAALAYIRFSEEYPDDESSDDALLKAADLFAAAGMNESSDNTRLSYVRKYPDDNETNMLIMEEFARRDLDRVGPELPISNLLIEPKRSGKNSAVPSHLADYLQRAAKDPELASPALIAEVRFLQAEEARATYEQARLTQPLKKSIASKKKHLDHLMSLYQKTVDVGVSEWAHASAYRIGQSLVGFGEALENSERPRDLSGDDLLAYEDVLLDESQTFYDRGEDVWADLIRQSRDDGEPDQWVTQAQESLWLRLANRFFFRPEVEFPVVHAEVPERVQPHAVEVESEIDSSMTSESESPELADGGGEK